VASGSSHKLKQDRASAADSRLLLQRGEDYSKNEQGGPKRSEDFASFVIGSDPFRATDEQARHPHEKRKSPDEIALLLPSHGPIVRA
jgi:hypothetical protein